MEEIPPQLVLPAEVRIKKGNAARHTNQRSREIPQQKKTRNIYSGSAGGEKIAPSLKVVPNQLGFYKPRRRKLQSSIKISGVFCSFVVLFVFVLVGFFFLFTNTYYQQLKRGKKWKSGQITKPE